MCNKAIDNYPHTWEFVTECYKIQEICDKAVNTHSSAIFFSECYKTQEMCDKAFDKSFLAFIYILDWYRAQEMCSSTISENPFAIRYFPDIFQY